jgi:hypothetical protein
LFKEPRASIIRVIGHKRFLVQAEVTAIGTRESLALQYSCLLSEIQQTAEDLLARFGIKDPLIHVSAKTMKKTCWRRDLQQERKPFWSLQGGDHVRLNLFCQGPEDERARLFWTKALDRLAFFFGILYASAIAVFLGLPRSSQPARLKAIVRGGAKRR